MKLEEAQKFAQEDANTYQLDFNIVLDQLSEQEDKYEVCSVLAMDILYPDIHKDYWQVVEVARPHK